MTQKTTDETTDTDNEARQEAIEALKDTLNNALGADPDNAILYLEEAIELANKIEGLDTTELDEILGDLEEVRNLYDQVEPRLRQAIADLMDEDENEKEGEDQGDDDGEETL